MKAFRRYLRLPLINPFARAVWHSGRLDGLDAVDLQLSKLRRDVRVSIKLPNLDTVWNQMSVGAEIISS
jgi:hypothetical protein